MVRSATAAATAAAIVARLDNNDPHKRRAIIFEIAMGIVMVGIVIGLLQGWWPPTTFFWGLGGGFAVMVLGVVLDWWRWGDLSH